VRFFLPPSRVCLSTSTACSLGVVRVGLERCELTTPLCIVNHPPGPRTSGSRRPSRTAAAPFWSSAGPPIPPTPPTMTQPPAPGLAPRPSLRPRAPGLPSPTGFQQGVGGGSPTLEKKAGHQPPTREGCPGWGDPAFFQGGQDPDRFSSGLFVCLANNPSRWASGKVVVGLLPDPQTHSLRVRIRGQYLLFVPT